MIATLAALVLALTPLQAYNQGNALYAKKDYAGAAAAYAEALKAGPSAAAYFNLGNALFKSGQTGRAILNYRRARYLAPRDRDIADNLAFARTFRVDRLLVAQGPLSRLADTWFRRLSHREATLWAAGFCLLASAMLAGWIVRRWVVFAVLAGVFGLLAVFGFVSRQMWASEVDDRPAVIVVPEVRALSGPSEDAKQILLAHDGTEVKIRELRGDYLLVQLPGAGGGWIPRNSVERVYP
jgi:tetratricopeptide (TPR) repeat protein